MVGRVVDPETSLTYLINRYYDPTTGQFLSVDPLVAQTHSAYGYVDNNPLNATDPAGLNTVSDLFSRGNKSLRGAITAWTSHISALCVAPGDPNCKSLAAQHPGVVCALTVTAGGALAVAGGAAAYGVIAGLSTTTVTVAGGTAVTAGTGIAIADPQLPEQADAIANEISTLAEEGESSSQIIYRTGSQTDEALNSPTGVSFRSSISSSADQVQVFQPGAKIWGVDTGELTDNSVDFDDVPDGHVSVSASPSETRGAIVSTGPDNPLQRAGLKPLEDLGAYRIPRR